ncbi:PadR family transcriptional regulator, partial [Cellulosimicrobium funkei]
GEHDTRRRESTARRAEAEAVLQRFRDELRADLRRADATGGVPELTVDTLRTVLDSARRAVRSTLP